MDVMEVDVCGILFLMVGYLFGSDGRGCDPRTTYGNYDH